MPLDCQGLPFPPARTGKIDSHTPPLPRCPPPRPSPLALKRQKAAPPREKSLQSSCLRILKSHGLLARKRHGSPFAVAGDPDLYFLFHGRHVEIELKRPGESPTPLQQARLAEWACHGAITRVIHSTTELCGLLSELDQSTGHKPLPR